MVVPVVSLRLVLDAMGMVGEDAGLVNIVVLHLSIRMDASDNVRPATGPALTHPNVDHLVRITAEQFL